MSMAADGGQTMNKEHLHHHTYEHENDHHHSHFGHNHHSHDHLHSHIHGDSEHERAQEIKVLTTAFVDGFRRSEDKTSYLRLANIPFSRKGSDGLKMHLIDVQIISNWQIGTASPAFASRELSYMPYPGKMVTERETMQFTYVSLTERADIDLVNLLNERQTI
jgi:hypothetical protein